MAPKKRTGVKKHSAVLIGKKPSPKKMSPKKTPLSSPKNKESFSSPLRVTRASSETISPQDLRDTPQYATPDVEKSPTLTPRSNERYELRDLTPVFYKDDKRHYPHTTPLRTPSGILRRTPARSQGRTPIGTPFRTPKLKSLGRERQPDPAQAFRLHKTEAVLWKQHLKLITSKKYKICNLSTMSNFRYKNKRLRNKYETHLKNKVLEVYPSPLLLVSLSTTSCLTLRPDVVDAVRIEINSLHMGEKKSDDEMVNVYNAWLFRTSRIQSQSVIEVEWFPVMLYNGRELIHHAVTDWLQGSFGCYITKYGIRQSDLIWIAGVWSGRPCSLKAHANANLKVRLTYQIRRPHGMGSFPSPNASGKPSIKFFVNIRDIHHVWKNIVDTSREEMTEEELCEFFTTMNAMAEKLTCIPVDLLSLHQLHTPCMNLTSDGMVRVMCTQSVRVIVNHLIDIFLQTSDCNTEDESLVNLFRGTKENEGENTIEES